MGVSVSSYLARLRDAGLGSLPGTAAEVLCDDVRAVICPDKLHSQLLMEVGGGVVGECSALGAFPSQHERSGERFRPSAKTPCAAALARARPPRPATPSYFARREHRLECMMAA